MTDDQGETTTSNQPKKPRPAPRKSRKGVLEKGLMAVIVPESSGSPGIGFLHYLLIKTISHSKKEVVGVNAPQAATVQLGRNSSHLATAIKASLTPKKGGPPCTNKVGRSRHFPGVTHPNHLRAGSKPSGGASFFSLMTGRDARLTN